MVLPKLRQEDARNQRTRTSVNTAKNVPTAYVLKGYLKNARYLGRRPVLLVPLPSRVGRNLTATKRCGTTTPANPSDGRSGYCALRASRQLPGNQHGKTKEERREKEDAHNRKTSPTPLPWELERDARDMEKNRLGKGG